MSNWPQQGIHANLPFELYRADDITQADTAETIKGKAISKSMIVDFHKDPGAWKSAQPKVTTGAMKAGSLLDCLMLTPDEIGSRYVTSPFDSFRTNEAKAWRAEQELAGVEVVTKDSMDDAEAQSLAIHTHPHAYNLVSNAKTQVAFRHDTKFGFSSKGLIDILPKDSDVIVDLKTCEPRALGSHRALQRHIFDWGYHIQAGCYCEGYSQASGEERIRFKFIFVSSKPPFRVAVIELPLTAILYGADLYRAGVKKFAECIEADEWPSIWDDEVELDLPEYAYLNEGGNK